MSFSFPTNEDLERLRSEMLTLVNEINGKLNSTTNESAELAAKALERIVLLENSATDSVDKLNRSLIAADHLDSQISQLSTELKEELANLQGCNKEISNKLISATDNLEVIGKLREEAQASAVNLSEKISEINSYIEQSEGFPGAIEKLSSQLSSAEENADKIGSLLSHSLKRKGEIDEVYRKVYGDDIKSGDAEIQHTDGIVDELGRAYDDVSGRLEKLGQQVESKFNDVTLNFKEKLDNQNKNFESLVNDSREKIESINDELRNLLPGAMAAGLSAAYEKKTKDEISSLENFNKTFNRAIAALVFISLIPFGVDIYLLGWQSKDLVQVIKDTPSLIVSILPLYFPVLWLAYSSNKKINLSKRLIEEYTHKAVLGKTFSGLSNQIDTLPNEDVIKGELRTRLLFNVLQVSAENPGKLISNYNKSDHPLMDALENSAKLADSVDHLAKIPGFGALAKKLAERSENLLEAQAKKVEQGLTTQKALDPQPAD